MATETTDSLIGQTVDRFRIERVIGKGSMGTVYYGVEANSRLPVAIKTMSPEHTDDEELLQRFQREARVGSEIKHPNVAHVFKSGILGEMPYLIMEFIDGPSLQEIIKQKGPIEPITAAGYVRQSALGLKVATSKGSIHRDIKPANIMLTSKGEIKIVDFGIARNHGGDSLRTSIGVVLGSPYYMSPEQSAAQPLDHRSDIFGLGATFYYLLTGRPPFEGKNLVEIIQKRSRNDLRPISAVNPNVPKRIIDIVTRMMMSKPEERFQSYDELIQALDLATKSAQRDSGFHIVEEEAPRAEKPTTPAPKAAEAPKPVTPEASRPVAAAAKPAPPPPRPATPQPVPSMAEEEYEVRWFETKLAWVGMMGLAAALIATSIYLLLNY